MQASVDIQEEVISLEDLIDQKTLVVHNDDTNTFDWVIKALIEVCDHSFEQAEQCSLLIHYKGKSSVKGGSLDYLRPMKDAIIQRGIKATID